MQFCGNESLTSRADGGEDLRQSAVSGERETAPMDSERGDRRRGRMRRAIKGRKQEKSRVLTLGAVGNKSRKIGTKVLGS